jgi:hypothetical protein
VGCRLEKALGIADADSPAWSTAMLSRSAIRSDHAAVRDKLAAARVCVASRERRPDAAHSVSAGVEAAVSRSVRIQALRGAPNGDRDQYEPPTGCGHRPSSDQECYKDRPAAKSPASDVLPTALRVTPDSASAGAPPTAATTIGVLWSRYRGTVLRDRPIYRRFRDVSSFGCASPVNA